MSADDIYAEPIAFDDLLQFKALKRRHRRALEDQQGYQEASALHWSLLHLCARSELNVAKILLLRSGEFQPAIDWAAMP
jgi:hypothetical protein